MKRIEKVAYDLDYSQFMLRILKKRLGEDRYQGPHSQAELKEEIEYHACAEKNLSRLLIALEDCEHPDCEDTGGPDGSQVCLDCGKEW